MQLLSYSWFYENLSRISPLYVRVCWRLISILLFFLSVILCFRFTSLKRESEVSFTPYLALKGFFFFSGESPEVWVSPFACMYAKSLPSCPALCDPVDGSRPGRSARGILQAGTLEWAALPSSRGSSRRGDQTHCLLCLLKWQAGSLPLAPPGKPKCLPLQGTLKHQSLRHDSDKMWVHLSSLPI